MKIRLLIAWGFYSKFAVIDPPSAQAEVMVRSGQAEYLKPMRAVVDGERSAKKPKAKVVA